MTDYSDKDFERFRKNAHTQIMLLHWFGQRMSDRQQNLNLNLNICAIEADFEKYCKEYQQQADFRFDRGQEMLMLAFPILVGGVDAVFRHSNSSQIIEHIVTDLDPEGTWEQSYDIKIETMDPLNKGSDINVWTLLKRTRNSMAHYRYNYINGRVWCTDMDKWKGKKTAEFSMPAMSTLDLSYRFGRACLTFTDVSPSPSS